MLLCLGAVALLLVAARIWRKRSQRLYNAAVGRCWPSKLSRTAHEDGPPDGGTAENLAGGRIAAAGLTTRGGKPSSDKEPMFSADAEFSDAPQRS